MPDGFFLHIAEPQFFMCHYGSPRAARFPSRGAGHPVFHRRSPPKRVALADASVSSCGSVLHVLSVSKRKRQQAGYGIAKKIERWQAANIRHNLIGFTRDDKHYRLAREAH